jgi:flagellin
MPFSINTNVSSLEAQNYLRSTSDFQAKTIARVTSGLRIVTSGDDAAGLAIANGYRSDEAVLTQGVRNANDGLSQLQTADGGISNISQLLDRARTLATQSASGAFTGDRGVLNSEFQSVVGEIDRQAQAIGLVNGGTLAKSLNLFIGGGQTANGIDAATNGSVNLDLSHSTVDATSLGLKGVQAAGAALSDIGTGSTTSVQNILANPTNLASISNNTTNFYITGPGFSDTTGSNVVKVAVNLTGVTDASTLATALNQAIVNTGNGASQQATAFKNANITAAINIDSSGRQQLTFNSSSAAFQVQGGDNIATALLGSYSSGAVGNSANVSSTAAAAFTPPTAPETVQIRVLGAGLNGAPGDDLSVALTTAETIGATVSAINTAIAASANVAATGIQAVNVGGKITFQGHAGQSFEVATAGDVQNALGFGSFTDSTGTAATGGTFNYSSITATGATTATNQHLQVSINGGATIDLGALVGSASELTSLANLNAAFQGNAATRAAGLTATDAGGLVKISSSAANFRLNFVNAASTGDAFGFGASPATGVVATGTTASAYTAKDSINSAGAQSSQNTANKDVYQFTGLRNTGDAQTVTLSAVDSNGVAHNLNVALNTTNANNLDQAVSTINQAVRASNDSTIKQLAAFKEEGTSGNVNNLEGIRFLSAGGSFKISLGASPASSTSGVAVGITDGATGTDGGAVLTSVANGTGSTADISNVSTAQNAVIALGAAVASLGRAQAVVGRGENQLNYAVNLASSQLVNLASAESRIRDSDLAAESANLTKSQLLLQAGIAALAQANSAPQQVLKLLQ